MSAKLTPGLDLLAEWDLGEDGWNVGMDENLRRLSAVASLSVPSVTAPLVEQSLVQIAPITHAEAGRIGAYRNGAWWFFQPFIGMRAHVRDRGRTFVFTSAGWTPASELPSYVVSQEVTGDHVINEAEFTLGAVIVVNSATDVTVTIPATIAGQTAVGSNMTRRPVTVVQAGEGRVRIVGTPGVTVSSADGYDTTRVRHSVCSIVPVGETGYVLAGDLAA